MTVNEAYNIIREFAQILKSPEPEDLAHDVVIRLINNQHILEKPDSQVRNWIFMVSRNRHIDNCRRKKTQPLTTNDIKVPEEKESKIEQLIKLANLSELEAMWLDAYMDMGDISKIARELEVNRTDVSKKLNKIFKKCRPYRHFLYH